MPGHGGLVEVEFPTVLIWDTPMTTWHTIHWPSNWNPIALAGIPEVNTGDPADNFDAIYHEFGHRLRHTADGDDEHFNWDMTRFKYARSHSMNLLSNEGFAFNEGSAEFHKSLFSDIVDVPYPDGTWPRTFSDPDAEADPAGDNVEGDVANQLFLLSKDCGGFPKLWATLRDAGPESIHSIDEFRAEFMQRNPLCGTKIKSPALRAPALGNAPSPTGDDQGSSSRRVRVVPGSEHAMTGVPGTGERAKPPGGSEASRPGSRRSSGRSSSRGCAPRWRTTSAPSKVIGRPPRRNGPARAGDAPRRVALRVQKMLARRIELDQAWHDEVTAAYREALDGLQGLPVESLADGSYEAKRRAAIAAFGGKVAAARRGCRRSAPTSRRNAPRRRSRSSWPTSTDSSRASRASPATPTGRAPPPGGRSRAARARPPQPPSPTSFPKSFWGTTRPRSPRR